jgi:hypothetical protein
LECPPLIVCPPCVEIASAKPRPPIDTDVALWLSTKIDALAALLALSGGARRRPDLFRRWTALACGQLSQTDSRSPKVISSANLLGEAMELPPTSASTGVF